MSQISHILGLDLGQSKDYSALAIVERTVPNAPRSQQAQASYVVGHLQRWPLHTEFTTIVNDTAAFAERHPLCNPLLAVDKTGVGAGPVEMLRHRKPKARMWPILITAGHQIAQEGGAWHVPKKELVSTMLMLSQSGRLQIAAVPEREKLIKELAAFRVKITVAGSETFEAWRERDHDDLVLAVALACWLGERCGGFALPDPALFAQQQAADDDDEERPYPWASERARQYYGRGGRPDRR